MFAVFASHKHFLFTKDDQSPLSLLSERKNWDAKDWLTFLKNESPYFTTPSGEGFRLDTIARRAYQEFRSILTKEKEISRKFTTGSIESVIKKHVMTYLEDGAQGHVRNLRPRDCAENMLQELLTSGEDLEVQFLANGLVLEDLEHFDFGKATFEKIDKACAEKIYPDIDFSKRAESASCPPVPKSVNRK